MTETNDSAKELTTSEMESITLGMTQRLTDALNEISQELVAPLNLTFGENANIATNACLNLLCIIVETYKDLGDANDVEINMQNTFNGVTNQLRKIMLDKETH